MLDPTFCTQKSTKCWIQHFVHKKVQNVGSPVFPNFALVSPGMDEIDSFFTTKPLLELADIQFIHRNHQKTKILRKNPDPTFCTQKSTKCWIRIFSQNLSLLMIAMDELNIS